MSYVFFITGYAGSGKTEFSKELSKATGATIIDKDTICAPFVDKALELLGNDSKDRESDIYVNELKPLEYSILRDVMEENISLGSSVIISAPFIGEFNSEGAWDKWRENVKAYGTTPVVVWVKSDEDTMKTRIISRGSARDENKLAHWDDYVKDVDNDLGDYEADFVVDNVASAPDLSEQAIALVRSLFVAW